MTSKAEPKSKNADSPMAPNQPQPKSPSAGPQRKTGDPNVDGAKDTEEVDEQAKRLRRAGTEVEAGASGRSAND